MTWNRLTLVTKVPSGLNHCDSNPSLEVLPTVSRWNAGFVSVFERVKRFLYVCAAGERVRIPCREYSVLEVVWLWGLMSTPRLGSKRIIFVRHAQALHNLLLSKGKRDEVQCLLCWWRIVVVTKLGHVLASFPFPPLSRPSLCGINIIWTSSLGFLCVSCCRARIVAMQGEICHQTPLAMLWAATLESHRCTRGFPRFPATVQHAVLFSAYSTSLSYCFCA
jgi:hypothetical protein